MDTDNNIGITSKDTDFYTSSFSNYLFNFSSPKGTTF